MRLIDADMLLYDDIECTDGNTYMIVHAPDIDRAKTAYDVDEVVASINKIGKRYCDSVKCGKNCDNCEHGCLMRAITGVVKSGGVANG